MYKRLLICFTLLIFIAQLAIAQNKIVVYQSDFGLKDGAVSEMKGVALGVSPDLKLYDLTHEIPNYNIGKQHIAYFKRCHTGLKELYLCR